MRVTFRALAAGLLGLAGVGCDPILNVEGSFFPAWMVSIAIGVVLTAVARYGLAVTGLEPHLGPPVLIYGSLGLLLILLTWLALFRV